MDIVVLVKTVPATESPVEPEETGKDIDLSSTKKVISPYDEYAIETALRIRDAFSGSVTILSCKEDMDTSQIRTALAMGADKGILITDEENHRMDQLTCARILAAALKFLSFNLVLAGERSADMGTGFTGPAVAAFLGIPAITRAAQIEVSGQTIQVRQETETGYQVLETELPALVSAGRGLPPPRFASMAGIMKARKKTIETIGAKTFLEKAPESRVEMAHFFLPKKRQKAVMLRGETAREKAKALVDALKKEKCGI